MANKVFHVTKQGKEDLEKELKELNDSRGDVADEIAAAKSNGDLSENAEYSAAMEKKKYVEARIAEIEEILDGAQIIQSDGDGTISLGDHVVVVSNGKETAFDIVGAIEANPADNKISHESPLGAALMGKKVGDNVSIKTPKGEKVYEVISVN